MNNYSFTISLRVFGGGISHADICETIGIPAKWSHRAGEPRIDPRGNLLGGVYSADYCSIDLPPFEGSSLPAIIQEQIKVLSVHSELFLSIKQSAGRSELFVGWFGSTNFGDTFPSDLLRRLGELYIDLSFDIYAGDLEMVTTP